SWGVVTQYHLSVIEQPQTAGRWGKTAESDGALYTHGGYIGRWTERERRCRDTPPTRTPTSSGCAGSKDRSEGFSGWSKTTNTASTYSRRSPRRPRRSKPCHWGCWKSISGTVSPRRSARVARGPTRRSVRP